MLLLDVPAHAAFAVAADAMEIDDQFDLAIFRLDWQSSISTAGLHGLVE